MTLYAASTRKIPAYLLMYKGAALEKIWRGENHKNQNLEKPTSSVLPPGGKNLSIFIDYMK